MNENTNTGPIQPAKATPSNQPLKPSQAEPLTDKKPDAPVAEVKPLTMAPAATPGR
jgi:hypothetical protein